MIIDEAIGLSAVIINETVGDKINKANAVINYLNDLNAPCLRLKRYTKNILNYICLFDYLFISSQMSAKPYFMGSTGILHLR